MKEHVKLGDWVEDDLTGFRGNVRCICRYAYNETSVGVASKELHEGLPVELKYFDMSRLTVIKGKEVVVYDPEAPKFGYLDEVEDTISGLKGKVVGISTWVSGCTRLAIASREVKEGIPVNEAWIPQNQCTLKKRGKWGEEETPKKKPGGPMRNPVARCFS